MRLVICVLFACISLEVCYTSNNNQDVQEEINIDPVELLYPPVVHNENETATEEDELSFRQARPSNVRT
ncbi:hypothetical protein Trydic_g1003 [Trypoxylus dichotomus]